MKRAFVLIFSILALIFTTCGIASAFQNEPPGFRGYMWGEQLENCSGLTKVGSHGDRMDYKRWTEDLAMGEATLQSVQYSFYKDRFFRVIIDYDDIWNYEDLKNELTRIYGKPMKAPNMYQTWWWMGDQVSIGLTYGVYTRGGTVSFIYTPIQKEREKDMLQAAAEGKKGF